MFCGLSTVDVSLGFASGNIDSLWSTNYFPRSQSISVNYIPYKHEGQSLLRKDVPQNKNLTEQHSDSDSDSDMHQLQLITT